MQKLKLTQGYFAQVSDEDYQRVWVAGPWFPLIAKRKDGTIRSIYARHNVRRKGKAAQQYLGQFILGVRKFVSHMDNDGLNCTRDNIRKSTKSQNIAKQRLRADNQAGFKGVVNRKGHFMAQIDEKYLGAFPTAQEAARAYDAAAKKKYGEFATLNFPR